MRQVESPPWTKTNEMQYRTKEYYLLYEKSISILNTHYILSNANEIRRFYKCNTLLTHILTLLYLNEYLYTYTMYVYNNRNCVKFSKHKHKDNYVRMYSYIKIGCTQNM